MQIVETSRNTKETEISLKFNLKGSGQNKIDTPLKFFNHMLEQLSYHGKFDIQLCAKSLDFDPHHIVEDVAIVLGNAFRESLGDKRGIVSYASVFLPMDDALVLASLDLSGRTYFAFDADLRAERLGTMETEVVREFFMGLAGGAQMNLHIRQLAGENTHHIVEAMFKAVAKAMDMASRVDRRIDGVLSTKGVL